VRAGYSGTDGGDPGSYVDAAVNVPIVPNKLGLRLVGSTEEIGGYFQIPSAGLENTNPAELSHLRANLLWAPTDKLIVKFLYTRNKSEQDGTLFLATLDPPVTISQPGDFNNRDYDLIAGTVEYHFGSATLSSTTSFIDTSWDSLSNLPFPVPGGILEYDVGTQGEAINNETRLVSQNDGPMQWVVGVFYSDSESTTTTDTNVPEILPGGVQELTSESISFFGELSWAFLDDTLIPLVGLRYFEDDRSSTDSLLAVQLEPATFDDVAPRFSLSYLPTENSIYYLNIAKGFRSGSFNQPVVCDVLHGMVGGLPCELAVTSDELWSYEIGTKKNLAAGQVALDAAIYYQDWKDNRQPVPFFGLFQSYQIGDAVIPGIDVGLIYTPASISGLTLRANGNWNDAHFTAIDPAISAAAGAEEGDRLPLVPEWTAAIAASYAWPVAGNWMGLASLGYSHLEPQLGIFGGGAEGDSRDLLRARLGFNNGSFGFYLFGNNLLNETGAIYAQRPPDGIDVLTQDYPRQVGLEITYDF